MWAAAYSRAPHARSSSFERQSTITYAGSSRCEASAAVEISVLKAMPYDTIWVRFRSQPSPLLHSSNSIPAT